MIAGGRTLWVVPGLLNKVMAQSVRVPAEKMGNGSCAERAEENEIDWLIAKIANFGQN